jgi:hypothetical protein
MTDPPRATPAVEPHVGVVGRHLARAAGPVVVVRRAHLRRDDGAHAAPVG